MKRESMIQRVCLFGVVLIFSLGTATPALAVLCGATAAPTWGKSGTTVTFRAPLNSCAGDKGGYYWSLYPPSGGRIDRSSQTWTHNLAEPGVWQWDLYSHDSMCFQCEDGGSITIEASQCTLSSTATVPSTGKTGDVILFNATATPTGCSGTVFFDWNFGDGSSHMSAQNTAHTYTKAGTYTWTMTAKMGTTESKKTGTITVSSSPTCQLTGSAWTESTTGVKVVTAKAGETIVFRAGVNQNANCSGNVSYYWNFGDGKTETGIGTDFDTTHVYEYEGAFNWTVVITVGTTEWYKTGTMTLSSGCTLVCTAAGPASGDGDETLKFTASATATNCITTPSYEWDFGDNWTSSLQNPMHSYSRDGVYTWAMTATADDLVCRVNGGVTIGVSALPNLLPYKPEDWSDKIVVSNVTGTTTDSNPLYAGDTLYVDWAVLNESPVGITTPFFVSLYIDGAFESSWPVSSLQAYYYYFATDYPIGPLGAGTHTITIVADSNKSIGETVETDNEYTKTIKVLPEGSTVNLPNLTPFQPKGWSDAIVLSTSKGNYTDSDSYSDEDDLYISCAVLNEGPAATPGGFSVDLYIDGQYENTWSYSSSLKASFYRSIKSYPIGWLSAGPHTIDIVIDSDDDVSESDEDDNVYTKEIWVDGIFFNQDLPNLTSYQPEGWSDKIVVSSSKKNSADGGPFTPKETLYVDWAVINNGKGDTPERSSVSLYVDGTLKKSWTIPLLKGSGTGPEPMATLSSLEETYYAIEHYPIGKLDVGEHTVTVVVDALGVILEEDEGDNEYNKTILIFESP